MKNEELSDRLKAVIAGIVRHREYIERAARGSIQIDFAGDKVAAKLTLAEDWGVRERA